MASYLQSIKQHKHYDTIVLLLQGLTIFCLGMFLSWLYITYSNDVYCWIKHLPSSEMGLLGSIIGAITTIVTAVAGVSVAFGQIRKQFEHKVIHNGWEDFLKKLFEFSSALSDFDSKIAWLSYFVRNQNNYLVNAGSLTKYRTDKWNEINESQQHLMLTLINLLRSFETHELIFFSLRKMKTEFNNECDKFNGTEYMDFMESIFPEFYGSSSVKPINEQLVLINTYWKSILEIKVYLEDFRIELQNETIGKILGRELERRKPLEACRMLTREGFVFFNP